MADNQLRMCKTDHCHVLIILSEFCHEFWLLTRCRGWECRQRGQSISRGGKTTKTFNTTLHTELHSELLKKCDERTKEKASAPTSNFGSCINEKRVLRCQLHIGSVIGHWYRPISAPFYRLSVIRISAKSYIGATLMTTPVCARMGRESEMYGLWLYLKNQDMKQWTRCAARWFYFGISNMHFNGYIANKILLSVTC